MSPRKTIVDTLHRVGSEHGVAQVWSDWCEGMALGWANALGNADPAARGDAWHAREARYLDMIRRYKPDIWRRVAGLQGALVELLEGRESGTAESKPAQRTAWIGGGDPLGELFMELELGNDRAGQFFTPWSLCCLMAKLHGLDQARDDIATRGYCTVDDCAVGSGSLLLAMAEEARFAGINPQTQIWFSGRDLGSNTAHMAYVNLCLRGLPGVIEHGDTLQMEIFGAWITPWHYIGGWPARLGQTREMRELRDIAVKVETMLAQVQAEPENEPEPERPKLAVGEQGSLF